MVADVTVAAGTVCVGVLKDDEGYYLASSRPRVIGYGENLEEAIGDWVSELFNKRRLARSLKAPLGPATENDVAKLQELFGGL